MIDHSHHKSIVTAICAYRLMTSSKGTFFMLPGYWPFVRGIHRSPVNSPHKGQWRGALMFSLIYAWTKQLSKQWRRRWFETPSCTLWYHCNDCDKVYRLDVITYKNKTVAPVWKFTKVKITPSDGLVVQRARYMVLFVASKLESWSCRRYADYYQDKTRQNKTRKTKCIISPSASGVFQGVLFKVMFGVSWGEMHLAACVTRANKNMPRLFQRETSSNTHKNAILEQDNSDNTWNFSSLCSRRKILNIKEIHRGGFVGKSAT